MEYCQATKAVLQGAVAFAGSAASPFARAGEAAPVGFGFCDNNLGHAAVDARGAIKPVDVAAVLPRRAFPRRICFASPFFSCLAVFLGDTKVELVFDSAAEIQA